MERDSGTPLLSGCHLLANYDAHWFWSSAVGLVFRVKRTVHFAELGVPASGETFNHAGPSAIPSWATVRGARLYSRRPVHHGRTFGELCSILCVRSRVQGGTLQVSRAGNAGKKPDNAN